jgi:hypothetical protein
MTVMQREGEFQSEEQLEEVGVVPAGELAEVELSEEMVKKQLSKETAELSLQGSGKSRPQVMETTWEIKMIFP